LRSSGGGRIPLKSPNIPRHLIFCLNLSLSSFGLPADRVDNTSHFCINVPLLPSPIPNSRTAVAFISAFLKPHVMHELVRLQQATRLPSPTSTVAFGNQTKLG
jgi:hypothetical protein